jgi:GT2 family glycosyltransferase
VLNGEDWDVAADAVVRNTTNLGFGAASNEGASLSHADLICFLNQDTIPQPNWLPPLIAAFDDPQVAIAGPRIVHPAGDLQTSGVRLWHGNGSAGGEEIKQELPTRIVDGVTGACLVIRRSVFNAVGGFDLSFRNGYEDCALCMSVNEAGYVCKYVAESTIVHYESVSGPERWMYAGQNVATMNAIWGNR